MPLGAEIFLVLFFLVLHAFFSLAETSILNVRKSRLRELIDDPETTPRVTRQAQTVLQFKSKPEGFIAAVQSGSVFFSFLAATYTTFIVYDHLWPTIRESFHLTSDLSLAIAFIAMIGAVTIADLTFGALIPKSIALHRSQSIALALSTVVRMLMRVLGPIIRLPVWTANMFLRPFRDHTSFTESRISEEELRVMLEEGARSGAIDKTENELIANIFEFRERTAREVMIPRTKMVALDADLSRVKVIEHIIEEGFTRLPVYQGSLDNILGVIYSKDVLALIEHPDLIILYDIIRPVPFVPETKLISELLRELQREKLHLAIVVDEFGGTAGLITLEDILEEIVGEIHDEYDEEYRSLEVTEDQKTVVLSADYAIPDANEELEKYFEDFHIPDEDEYESVSGYVNKLFGHIPEVGEERETQGVRITVTKKGPMAVSEVKFEASRDGKRTTANA
jgi:CBS domain containing-hemolysin-like protein